MAGRGAFFSLLLFFSIPEIPQVWYTVAMENKNAKKPASRVKTILKIALVTVLAAIVLVGLRFAYVMFIDPMSAFGGNPTPAPAATPTPEPTPTPTPVQTSTPAPTVAAPTATPTQEPEPTPTPTPEPTPAPTYTPKELTDLSFMKDRVNILMLGWDESPERNVEGSSIYRDENNNFRSDVIMLLTVNFRRSRADLISIPRDTFATIYNDKGERFSETGHWKINAAFAKGGSAEGNGFAYAMQTVSKLFGGIPINYYAGVDMTGLKAVVDAMGGVDYDVDVRIELNGRVLETGYQHLNGQQVLDYCRARKGISTDVGRNDRQQRMLFAVFNQLKSRDQLKNLVSIYNSVKGYVNTNLSAEQIAALGTLGMKLDESTLKRHTLSGTYIDNTSYSNASYYVLYNDKLVSLVEKIFGITIEPDPRADAAHVEGEKQAAISVQYAASAEYLLSLADQERTAAGQNSAQGLAIKRAALAVKDALEPLPALAERPAGVSTDVPLDGEAIKAAVSTLREEMLTLADSIGLTRANADKSLFPSDFYKKLPGK